MYDVSFARAEAAWLRAPEPTELDEKIGEALEEATDYAVDYANEIIEKAKKLDSIEDLKKLLAEVEDLASSLEESISEIENLEAEYEM